MSGAGGCRAGDAQVEYETYAGTAVYPDRRPKLPAPKGYFAFVSDNGSDTVSVLDLPSNEVIAKVPVGRDPIGIDGPHHLAVDAQGTVYVALQYPAPAALPGPHAAHASSTRPGYVLKLSADDLHSVAEVQIDPNPGEIVISPDGKMLLVTHFDLSRALDLKLDAEGQKATIALIDTTQMGTPGAAPPRLVKTCRAPHGASIAADGRTAYVACYADDALAVIDLTTNPPAVTSVSVGSKGPYSAVLSARGAFVAVGNTDAKETRIFDTASRTMKPIAIITQGAPYFAAWSPDDAKLWIPTQVPDAVVLVDVATGKVLRQRVLDTSCVRPHEMVLGRDASMVYLVCEGDHRMPSVVLGLDAQSLETRATMPVGVYPDRLAFSRGP